jgi:hypothetical protein
MAARKVHSNMSAEDISEALLSTFQKWVEFALGQRKLGGKMLKNPSGRLAAALRAETDREGNVVAIYVDPDTEGAEVNQFLIYGHKAIDMKAHMLKAGKKGVKMSEEGYLYRRVPIAEKNRSPQQTLSEAARIVNLFTSRTTPQGGVIGINKNLARMWVSNYKKAHTMSDNIRTMTNKPGSARWIVPAMPAFKAGKFLKDMLPNKIKDRVII